jgi:uncharacterized protein (AIM24 family)
MTEAATSTGTCEWCGTVIHGSPPTCPACGGSCDITGSTSRSGWTELPPIPDMAKIQFGGSSVQIEGNYVPVADFDLHGNDAIYFSHHTLLWKDEPVPVTRSPLGSAWKRMIGGLPLVMAQAEGPGRIALSMDRPGETVAVPIAMGSAVDVLGSHFLAATNQVGYEYLQSGVWYTTRTGDETETHYPIGRFIDRFYALEDHGLLLLHAGGNVFRRDLAPGQTICIKPPSLLYKDPGVGMALHFEQPRGTSAWQSRQYRYVWLRLWGPGRVCIQSQYGHFHDKGNNIRARSLSTDQVW